jgi:hypothetical protein
MSITASGMYGLTIEKSWNATVAWPTNGLESETAVSALLVNDSYTPNFDTHDFYNDVTNEIANGGGYTTGGVAITSTELTISSGVLTFDSADPSWTSSTISSAMAAVLKFTRGGASSADELILLSDFVTAASTTNGTFLVQVAAGGWFTNDYTP